MLIMLNPCSGKNASYAGNVNNVNNCLGKSNGDSWENPEMLIILII